MELKCLKYYPQHKNMSLYDDLELTRNATGSEIKRSYYKLCLKYHPDKNSSGADIFVQLEKSYKILSNSNLRIIYDYGHLDMYLNMKDAITKALTEQPGITDKLLSAIDYKITANYNKDNIISDLAKMDLDKIAAILMTAHYTDDKVFKNSCVKLVLVGALSYGVVWAWNMIKKCSKYAFCGLALYYVFYKRILF